MNVVQGKIESLLTVYDIKKTGCLLKSGIRQGHPGCATFPITRRSLAVVTVEHSAQYLALGCQDIECAGTSLLPSSVSTRTTSSHFAKPADLLCVSQVPAATSGDAMMKAL